MLEDVVGLLSGRWSLVEGRSAFFGFVDHAEAGYVAAESWDGVVRIEGVGDGCVGVPLLPGHPPLALLAPPYASRRGWVGVESAVGMEVEVGEFGSGERPFLLCSPFATVVEMSVGVLCAVAAAHDEEENWRVVFNTVGFVFEPSVEPSTAYGVEFGHAPLCVRPEIDIALVGCVGSLGAVCPWSKYHVGWT